MKVVVAGGTGFIGAPLCRELAGAGHEVVALSRNVPAAQKTLGAGVKVMRWDPGAGEIPAEALDGADGIVNLAGESIASGRWTRERKERILASRIQATRSLVEAAGRAREICRQRGAADGPQGLVSDEERPRVLVNASAIGFYGPHGDEELREDVPAGQDFLAWVCLAWEAEAKKAEALGLRVVTVRIGVVLGEGGGALARMITPFKLFAGGPVGTGGQWFSWVHRDDVVGIIRFALEHENVRGSVNATGPEPLTMRDFSGTLGRVLGRPSWLPVPGFLLRVALGEMSDMLLNGQRVLPAKAIEAGYRFRFTTAEEALRRVLRS